MPDKKNRLLQVRMPLKLAQDAAQTAEREGESLSTIVRRLLREWLERRKTPATKTE